MPSTNFFTPERRRFLAVICWVLWVTFLAVWAVALVPFYARGLQLASDISLQYAGGGYARFNIPYVPLYDDVYGNSIIAEFASVVVCFGPCIFALAVGGMSWRMLTSWRTYSRLGMVLRIMALLITFLLIVLSYDMAGKFFIWGLG